MSERKVDREVVQRLDELIALGAGGAPAGQVTDINEIASTVSEIANWQSIIAPSVSEVAENIDDVTSTVSEVAGSVEGLVPTVSEVAGNVENVITTVSEVAGWQENIGTTLSEVAEWQSQIAPTASEIANWQAQVAPTASEIANWQSLIAPTISEVADWQSKISPTVSEIANWQAQIAPTISEIANWQEQIAPTISEVADWQAKISPTVSEIADWQAKISPTVSEIANWQSEIAESVTDCHFKLELLIQDLQRDCGTADSVGLVSASHRRFPIDSMELTGDTTGAILVTRGWYNGKVFRVFGLHISGYNDHASNVMEIVVYTGSENIAKLYISPESSNVTFLNLGMNPYIEIPYGFSLRVTRSGGATGKAFISASRGTW
jgi:peptidoglycan hydrolase CwlO-like protein